MQLLTPAGDGAAQITFDFVDHQLQVETISAKPVTLALELKKCCRLLYRADVSIWPKPVEIVDPIPFDADDVHTSYDRDAVETFFRALLQVKRVFEEVRASSSTS